MFCAFVRIRVFSHEPITGRESFSFAHTWKHQLSHPIHIQIKCIHNPDIFIRFAFRYYAFRHWLIDSHFSIIVKFIGLWFYLNVAFSGKYFNWNENDLQWNCHMSHRKHKWYNGNGKWWKKVQNKSRRKTWSNIIESHTIFFLVCFEFATHYTFTVHIQNVPIFINSHLIFPKQCIANFIMYTITKCDMADTKYLHRKDQQMNSFWYNLVVWGRFKFQWKWTKHWEREIYKRRKKEDENQQKRNEMKRNTQTTNTNKT